MANFANLARGMSRAPETPANTPPQLQTSKYEGDHEAACEYGYFRPESYIKNERQEKSSGSVFQNWLTKKYRHCK